MLTIGAIGSAVAVVTQNLPALVALGLDVWGFLGNAKQKLGEVSGGSVDELAAANQAVADLEAQVDARVEELRRLAPNS